MPLSADTATATATRSPAAVAAPSRPGPTIRTMIVCVPDGVATATLHASAHLQRWFGAPARLHRRFFSRPRLGSRQRRHLIDHPPTRRGGPGWCAGGPVGLLDLTGTRHAAAMGAALRHQYWSALVRGTRPATPWPVFWQRHLEHPDRHPYAQAVAEFDAQPRVQAMRLHNAATVNGCYLDPGELEILQAGPGAYGHFHALHAVCGDAVATAEGRRRQPVSDHLADRIAYLAQAIGYLEALDPGQRLIAVTLPTHPLG